MRGSRLAARAKLKGRWKTKSKRQMTTSTLVLIVLVILLVGLLPTWPYSRGWGYYPSGALGAILLIVFLLLIFGRL
jgi:hypothetical protein